MNSMVNAENSAKTKTCTKCGETKPVDDFSLLTRAPDGREWRCKRCKRQSAKESQKKRQGQLNAKARDRYRNNEIIRSANAARLKKWRAENKDKVKAQKKRAAESLSKRKASGDEATLLMLRERYKRTRQKRISDATKYAHENPEKVRAWKIKSGRDEVGLLKDSYIKKVLGINDAPDELIDLKRYQLRIARATKKLKKTIKEI